MSDDLSMEALEGTIGERGRDVVAAGCDVALYCKGVLEQMVDVAQSVPALEGKAKQRFDDGYGADQKPAPFDEQQALSLLARLSS